MGLFGAHSFAHGIHPPEAKADTSGSAIRQFPFAPVQVVLLSQHLGKPAQAIVREEEEVRRGQAIARPDGDMSVAMHAPVSGVVKRLSLAPNAAGQMVPAVFIQPFAASTQEITEGKPCDATCAQPEEILQAIQLAGIVGLGGAAFPTHVKLRIPQGKSVDTVVVNGAECEPYLTTDHRVMLEQGDDIFMGIRYLLRVTGAQQVILGLEENKRDAAESLRARVPADLPVSIQVLRVKYPQGAEKMLLHALLGRQVPSGRLPLDVHAVCINVATTAEIGRLLPHGRGIVERVITVTGNGVKDKGNYRVPIGTPVRFVLDTVGVSGDLRSVVLGGPMMGPPLANLDVPITKGTSGVLALAAADGGQKIQREFPCIRCARCIDACPMLLNPSELGLLARSQHWDPMASEYHLMDCFECGACSYVCPSHIPLVQHFRIAKAAVRRKKAPL